MSTRPAVYCLLGAFQFSGGIRRRHPRWRRAASRRGSRRRTPADRRPGASPNGTGIRGVGCREGQSSWSCIERDALDLGGHRTTGSTRLSRKYGSLKRTPTVSVATPKIRSGDQVRPVVCTPLATARGTKAATARAYDDSGDIPKWDLSIHFRSSRHRIGPARRRPDERPRLDLDPALSLASTSRLAGLVDRGDAASQAAATTATSLMR